MLQGGRDMKLVLLVAAALLVLLPRGAEAADSLQVRQVAKCAPYITRTPAVPVGLGLQHLAHTAALGPARSAQRGAAGATYPYLAFPGRFGSDGDAWAAGAGEATKSCLHATCHLLRVRTVELLSEC